MNRREVQAELTQPSHDGVEAVEPGRIERGAEETHSCIAIADACWLNGPQPLEVGEPARAERPQLAPAWNGKEADPLPGHRVFVTTGHVEHPVADGGKIHRHRPERMVAIDHHERVVGASAY